MNYQDFRNHLACGQRWRYGTKTGVIKQIRVSDIELELENGTTFFVWMVRLYEKWREVSGKS